MSNYKSLTSLLLQFFKKLIPKHLVSLGNSFIISMNPLNEYFLIEVKSKIFMIIRFILGIFKNKLFSKFYFEKLKGKKRYFETFIQMVRTKK